ncbi:hypothetical protein PBRA_009201 [Plasmodiophora brassicae]|uniref:Uncharacterized protein n=1 Tax=Plasmodiophora brassicae TaxID=37360 RepID=A0A0G4J5U5_PLABS|nr:hypothetical protein PBRA_009201 [Plasmodiophora brassicae]
MSCRTTTSTESCQHPVIVFANAAGQLGVFDSDFAARAPVLLSASTWHIVTFVVDVPAGAYALYVDGKAALQQRTSMMVDGPFALDAKVCVFGSASQKQISLTATIESFLTRLHRQQQGGGPPGDTVVDACVGGVHHVVVELPRLYVQERSGRRRLRHVRHESLSMGRRLE